MRTRLLAPVLVPLTALAVLSGIPSAASAADPAPVQTAVPVAPATPPTAGVDAAQAVLSDLQAEAQRVSSELTEGTAALEQGQARLAEVRAEAVRVRAEAQAAVVQADDARTRLGALVGAAYRNPQPSDVAMALGAAPGDVGDVILAAADLDHVRGNQQDVLREATAERVAAQELVGTADTLEADAAERERALAVQVTALQDQAQAAAVRLEAAAETLRAAKAERAAAEARASRDAAAARAAADAAATAAAAPAPAPAPAPAGPTAGGGPAFVPGPAGAGCGGGSLSGYANGLIPADALCPLVGTQGLLLRADAAAAFNAMAQVPGMPCPGNSYRSYSEQVALYGVKPGLAAVPGSSNHGWGVAIDFACGAERFGSAAFLWLTANGPKYGWNHPSWAAAGGSRPEPWHWEYTG